MTTTGSPKTSPAAGTPGTAPATAATPAAAPARVSQPWDMYNPNLFRFEPHDRELFDKFCRSFVPPGSFDAHAHIYDLKHIFPTADPALFGGSSEVNHACIMRHTKQWMGDLALTDGLYFPMPKKGIDSTIPNEYLANDLAPHPESRALMMIEPKDDPAHVEAMLRKHKFAGFKVYHLYAARPDTFNSDQSEFLPEWAWELANKYGLWITMHMVLQRAIADTRNQRYIREHCLRYPNANMVLAHSARGFCSGHTYEGIDSLRGLDNVFFDSSAVCEPGSHEAILGAFGSTRLMYGSDFGISELRGKAVTVNDGFYWMYDNNVKWEGWGMCRNTLAGIEALMALKRACSNMKLKDSDVEKIFIHNARQLLRIDSKPDGQKVQALYRDAKAIIPGGTQLLSKRPEMFAPDQWPAYYDQAIGCEVIDTDGRKFLDFSAGGILATVLGYADPDVNAAVIRRVNMGSMATLQTADEVEVARLLTQIHPWSAMARFTRSGGEAMTVAVRIARAATGRDKVAICGYHGWHDWYLAANLGSVDEQGKRTLDGHLLPGLDPKGVPRGLAGTALTFRYNQLDELDRVIAKHGGELAAIVMETTRGVDPEPGFLEGVRERASRIGAKLIFDEISIGWRLCLGGAHLKFGVNPDMAVFAKTITNGYAFGAILGDRPTMQAAQESFISSAYWTEGVGPAAAVAAIRKMMRIDVPAHLRKVGSQVMQGWADLAKKHNIGLKVTGRPEVASFAFDVAGQEAPALATFFVARMLAKGFLAGTYFNPMLAHQDQHVAKYLAATDETFAELAKAIAENKVKEKIGGPVKHTGFARLIN
ncbi:MAG: aminotransferase class III-fold pyridoxal phosphate-dependent enzyme [Planctomycetota bacterium]|nr:aminotransferase class III-fold pyridoxal phosphate-dependent enzyme [Planctomycetota bacterium]